VALYCCVPVPGAMETVAGATRILVSVAFVTVRTPVIMVEVPAVRPAAIPPLVMVATAGVPLDQVAVDVQLLLVPLE
jgi:hypothetical protein